MMCPWWITISMMTLFKPLLGYTCEVRESHGYQKTEAKEI